MHKIFGTKQKAEYLDRQGAYLVPINNNQVAVVRTPKGYFFIGGGLDADESHLQCIARECLEETGYTCCVQDKLCSAEMYTNHPTLGYFHPIQTYYVGKLIDKQHTPVEKDHVLCWVDLDKLRNNMFVPMQNWALEQLITKTK